MAFTPPAREAFKDFSVAGLTDMAGVASTELSALTASMTDDSVTEEQLTRAEELQGFIASVGVELQARHDRAARAAAASVIPTLPTFETPAAEPEPVVAAAEEPAAEPVAAAADSVKDVAATTPAGTGEVVEATVTASTAVANAPRRSVQIADAAPYSPAAEVLDGEAAYTIVAAADVSSFPMGSELSWESIGKAFEERVRPHGGMTKGRVTGRHQAPLATIKRNFPEGQVVMEGDSHPGAFAKLKKTSDSAGREGALVAANGWCAPSTPDYSICNPITTDGLLSIPEMVLRRGGLLHNQGLDFGDFFGNDFVLPIPGYNILTEAQVISDTAKTCVEIPCPEFVDDRLNVAALCLTSSLLQNRGYPEFVSEFVQGAIAAMAHLVNREVVNEIETGSTAITLSTVDPWVTDGTVWSQLMAAIDMVAKNIRYIYRTSRTQTVQMVFPYWVQSALRSDWLRRNATHTEELTDQMISAALARRYVTVQWIYDWQDAFDPTNGAGAIDVNHQFGNGAGPIAAAMFNNPTSVTFLAFLPGTWVLGRQDVIRLDTVYDSTNLQQNLVTQLFMEDGFRPMRMCQHSFAYTINICASGSTGVQRAVACADVTP
jgi:hypothetical protein